MAYESLLKDFFYIKIIILYALKHYKKPLTCQKLTDIVLDQVDIDYFDLQSALYELLKISYVRVNMTDIGNVYALSPDGETGADLFEDKIPYLIRKKIDFCIKRDIETENPVEKIDADVMVTDKGEFNTYLRIYETGDLLFELNVNAGSRDLAYKIKNHFKENYEKIYQETVKNIMKGLKE